MTNTFALRAASIWVSYYAGVVKHPDFKLVKASVEKGGGKLSTKTIGANKYVIVKSMYVSPNPLERAGWKMVSFESVPSTNTLVMQKGEVKVRLQRSEHCYLSIASSSDF